VAQATPAGRGGVAIVRVSGPLVRSIANRMLGSIPLPRAATYLNFLDADQTTIDEGLALFFPAPHSFTGEDVLELQGHGGPAVVDMLIQSVIACGARIARPGEFSERAFLNDKLDLAQAEAIADLIDAASTQAARSALRSLQGEFSRRINTLVETITGLRMYIEAAIDFAEEEIDFLAANEVMQKLQAALAELNLVLAQAQQGTLLRDGITAVIVGKPNVGKSSLLNYLSGRETAIVTEIPGTTRDVLREQITLDGMPLHIIDTAGIRVSPDLVEQEGIRRAHVEMAHADLILVLQDASHPDEELLSGLAGEGTVIVVRNKIDLKDENPTRSVENQQTVISLSAKTGAGMDLLIQEIKTCAGFATTQEGTFSARRRHLDALARARDFLQNGVKQLQHKAGELLAEDLRLAQLALAEITGEFSADDLLGRIFASFCVGK
jgi:tRNA modification GTPase